MDVVSTVHKEINQKVLPSRSYPIFDVLSVQNILLEHVLSVNIVHAISVFNLAFYSKLFFECEEEIVKARVA